MVSTRKKNGGKKKTLKYGGGRNNYKKGSFKNRRKMTIRNGEGLKGGMYRLRDENNFKKTDSEDTIRDKLTRMYTRKPGRPSDVRDYMEADWERYLSSISKADRTKMEALARTVEETVKPANLPASSTGRKNPSPSRGSAVAASSASLDDEDKLYHEMSKLALTKSKQSKNKYDSIIKEITGKSPSIESSSHADFQEELDAIMNGTTSSRKLTRAQEKELSKGLAELGL
jgi:hypothetical protein